MALTLNSTGAIVVDDNDLGAILYQPPGAWERNGLANVEYKATTHGTQVVPATATFTFNGTAVAVYGTVDNLALSQYTIDDRPPVTYLGPNPDIMASRFQTLFYHSPLLPDGPHRLVVSSLTNDTSHHIWLDYFIYQPSPSHFRSNSTTGANNTTDTCAAERAQIAGLAGGLGSGLLIMTIIVLVFLWKHRRPSPYHVAGKEILDPPFPVNMYPQIDPYVVQAEPQPGQSLTSSNPQYQDAGVSLEQGIRPRPYTSKFVNPLAAVSGLPSTPSSSLNVQSTQRPSSSVFTDTRENVGATLASPQTDPMSPIGVPPAYSQSFRT